MRGRKPIQVDVSELRNQIEQLEKQQPDGKFPNRSALWSAIEATEWAKSQTPRPLTSQVAMLMAKKHTISILSPVGKRGREKGSGPIAPGVKRTRKPMNGEAFVELKKVVPLTLASVVEKAGKGSLKAAIKLKCMDCVCYQKKEVALCDIKDCSLWSFRPYKQKDIKRIELETV